MGRSARAPGRLAGPLTPSTTTTAMEHGAEAIELVFVLLAVAIALSYLARFLRIADPILLLLGGVALGFVPDLPHVELPPDLVFLLFLPPILFAAAYFTPIRDFRANAQAIISLAVGLVLFTTIVVGFVVDRLVPGLGLPAALTLGAIVAPPDAVAATAIFQRLGVPRRVVTILEGESLINDASALIAYRVTSAVAVGAATFSLVDSSISFVVVGIGGILVGLVIGAVVTRALHRTGDPVLEIVVSLIAPATAYLAAELVGVSGVLATVVAGLITGRRAARVFSPDARLLGRGVWQVVIWAINAFVFMLIGLQLPTIMAGLAEEASAGELIWYGVVVSVTVIGARFAWIFAVAAVTRALRGRLHYPWRGLVVVSWAGMRGVVSLAAALALAADFPGRPLILYLTFCVIVATLVGQGLTLPWLIHRLGVTATADDLEAEETHARLAAVEAGLRRLDELRAEFPGHDPLFDQLRTDLEHEASHVLPAPTTSLDEAEQERFEHRAIRMALLLAQREAVIALRDGGIINDETLRRIERELDLEALRADS